MAVTSCYSRSFGIFISSGSYPCQVISGSFSGVKTQSFVVLVMLKTAYGETFHVLQFEGISIFTLFVKTINSVSIYIYIYIYILYTCTFFISGLHTF